jgi:hypothetical protein
MNNITNINTSIVNNTNNTNITNINKLSIEGMIIIGLIPILLCSVPLFYCMCYSLKYIFIPYCMCYGNFSDVFINDNESFIIKKTRLIFDCLFGTVISPKLNQIIIIKQINNSNNSVADIVSFNQT